MSDIKIECIKIYLNSLGDISISCMICNASLSSPNKLIKHIQAHFSEIPYQCYLCDNFYPAFDKLIFHIKEGHKHKLSERINYDKETDNILTDSCDTTLDDGLEEHQIEPEVVYVDEHDNQKYNFLHKVKDNRENNYEAIKEDDLFNDTKNVNDISDHIIIEPINLFESSENGNNVTKCHDQKFNHKHNSNDESEYKSESICTRKLNRNCNNPLKRQFMCDICGKCFTFRSTLRDHSQTHVDPVDRDVACKICHKRFTTESYLKVHLRYHNNVRPYKCEICNKSFYTHSHWRCHSLIHLNIKPFKCDVCNKQFTQANSLKEHKRIHTGEKPFKCDLCDLGFRKRDALVNHRRIHTGEKPHKCEICLKRYPSKAAIYSHMKSQHKNV